MRSPRRLPGLTLGLVVAAAVGACSGGTSPTTGPTAAGATKGTATQQLATSPTATTAPTKAGGTGTAQVDLLFSGTRAITAKGTAGRCILVTMADGRVQFGFEATEADYPGLGLSYSMANLNDDYVDIKWVIETDISYGNPAAGGGTLSADHHSVTIDVDLSPFTMAGGTTPGPEHVKGTISCP